MSESPRHTSRVRKHRVLKTLALTVAVVLVLALTGGFFVYRHLNKNITAMNVVPALGTDRPTEKVKPNVPTQPLNILLLGSDTRKGPGNKIGGETPGLSDTTILLHVSADRKLAYGVSLPRDAMVQRPDCVSKDGKSTVPGGLSMFNAAYAVGGPACTIKTVEKLTKVRINHFVVIDFNGFKKMVDALGGVEVCVPQPVNDTTGHIYAAGRDLQRQGPARARLRPRPARHRHRGERRHRPDEAAADVPGLDGQQGGLRRAPWPTRCGSYKFLDAATKSLTTDPELASLNRHRRSGEVAQGDRPRPHPVPHRALRGLPAGPEPAAVGAGRHQGVGQHRNDMPDQQAVRRRRHHRGDEERQAVDRHEEEERHGDPDLVRRRGEGRRERPVQLSDR